MKKIPISELLGLEIRPKKKKKKKKKKKVGWPFFNRPKILENLGCCCCCSVCLFVCLFFGYSISHS